MKILWICATLILTTPAFAGLSLGEIPPDLKLTGADGGKTTGEPWDAKTMRGKVHFVAYVDPDEKDANTALEEALKKENFSADNYQSVGIINMAATWLPNFAIASALESKQEKFPQVVYVKDKTKKLVKEWGVEDDAYVVLIFDKEGKTIWHSAGTLDAEKIKALIATIKAHF